MGDGVKFAGEGGEMWWDRDAVVADREKEEAPGRELSREERADVPRENSVAREENWEVREDISRRGGRGVRSTTGSWVEGAAGCASGMAACRGPRWWPGMVMADRMMETTPRGASSK